MLHSCLSSSIRRILAPTPVESTRTTSRARRCLCLCRRKSRRRQWFRHSCSRGRWRGRWRGRCMAGVVGQSRAQTHTEAVKTLCQALARRSRRKTAPWSRRLMVTAGPTAGRARTSRTRQTCRRHADRPTARFCTRNWHGAPACFRIGSRLCLSDSRITLHLLVPRHFRCCL